MILVVLCTEWCSVNIRVVHTLFFFSSLPKKYLLAAFKTVNLSCNRTVAHQCAAKGRHRSTWKFFRSLNLMAASMYTKSIHRDTVGRQTPLSEKAKQHKDVRAWLIYKAVIIKKKVPKASTFCIYLITKFRKCWSRGSWFNTTSVGWEDQQPKTPCWTLKRDSQSSPHTLLI